MNLEKIQWNESARLGQFLSRKGVEDILENYKKELKEKIKGISTNDGLSGDILESTKDIIIEIINQDDITNANQ